MFVMCFSFGLLGVERGGISKNENQLFLMLEHMVFNVSGNDVLKHTFKQKKKEE